MVITMKVSLKVFEMWLFCFRPKISQSRDTPDSKFVDSTLGV